MIIGKYFEAEQGRLRTKFPAFFFLESIFTSLLSPPASILLSFFPFAVHRDI
jgi:hypothetical protein